MCERVNASKDVALAVTGLGTGVATGTTATMSTLGYTAVTHSSGAVILTGSAGFVPGTLGTAAASALGIHRLGRACGERGSPRRRRQRGLCLPRVTGTI